MSTYWDKILEESELISLPEVYIRLQQVLGRDDYSMQEVTEVIQYDPAITTRLLNLVRSAYLGLGPRIDTVGHAVNYLGARSVHDLVLTTVLADSFSQIRNDAFNLQDFWHRSVKAALIARNLTREVAAADAERLFIAGLIHDIGQLLMQQVIPQQMRLVIETAREQSLPRHLVERQQLGFDAAAVGAELLGRWKLPETLVGAIAFRHEPEQAGDNARDAALVALGALQSEADPRLVSDRDKAELAGIAGLDPAAIEPATEQAEAELDEVIRMLFPHLTA
jgi:HD-like signal output (HDOD) protein